MGLTFVELTVKRNKESETGFKEQFLVDSGAIITVAPGALLTQLGVEPDEEHTFHLANGDKVTRRVGDAYFVYGNKGGNSKVIFGQEDDSKLLGALTLESLGLTLDPLKRELKPLPMLLM